MAFRFKTIRSRKPIALPSLERTFRDEEEPLTGQVSGMKASAQEEYMAKALTKANIPFIFRYTVGAPRGLPGWKELDFVISHGGVVYLMEMDTAFTHRTKEQKDVLHDAIALNDRELQSLGTLWPSVLHVDGDSESADAEQARNYVKRRFGK